MSDVPSQEFEQRRSRCTCSLEPDPLAFRARVHTDRASRRDLDHRRTDRAFVASRAVGPRGSPPRPVHQQSQANRARDAQLRELQRIVSHGILLAVFQRTYGYTDAAGELVRLTQFIEQGAIYNAMNFSIPMLLQLPTRPSAARGLGVALVPERRHDQRPALDLSCQQWLHMTAAPADDLQQLFRRAWDVDVFPIGTGVDHDAVRPDERHVSSTSAWPPGVNPFIIYGNSYPNTGSVSPVKIASITDGLSNTIAFGEHAHGLFSMPRRHEPGGQFGH